MAAEDALLVIDANKYLDLFRTDSGSKLLKLLSEQKSYIFVTQQIVDEVKRNKINVAADYLRKKSSGLNLSTINVPDQFAGGKNGGQEKIIDRMRLMSREVSDLKDEVTSHTTEIMTQIAESKDEVSVGLKQIFSRAVSASKGEFARARIRKELGNPPGKPNDPLGDEVTWEQILSEFVDKRKLWIISRDRDFSTSFEGTLYLNQFLKSELLALKPDAEIYIFEDLLKGINHFIDNTKVESETVLTPEEIKEIEEEESSLSQFDLARYNSNMRKFLASGEQAKLITELYGDSAYNAGMEALNNSIWPNSTKLLENIKSNEDAYKAAMESILGIERNSHAMKAIMKELGQRSNDSEDDDS